MITFSVAAGILMVLALIIGIGLRSGKNVKDAKDFLSGGGKAGAFLVSGAILGSLVSSQATIGTAQLAFHYGFAAWWFTLGSGIGCLILGVCYAKRLRASGSITELQVISKEYGSSAGSLGSVLSSTGIFISVLAQVVACTGLLTVLFPAVPHAAAALSAALLMCVYVIFGGAFGAGMGGVVKLILLSFTALLGIIYVCVSCGGPSGLKPELLSLFTSSGAGSVQGAASGLSDIHDLEVLNSRYFSLIARGAAKDLGSGLSLLLGVLSTQTYAQAIWSARSDSAARRGALLSAFLIPPIGIGGIMIGLFMRSHYLLASEVRALTEAGLPVPDLPVLPGTIQVFPAFVLNHLPGLLSGIILGTLLITVVGGGAGLSLGMATILVKDIAKKLTNAFDRPERELLLVRSVIGAILLIAVTITLTVPTGAINDLGFLSMGLRGSVVFLPLTFALFLPGRADRRVVPASMVLSTAAVLAAKACSVPFDPLFAGIGVSALCLAAGMLMKRAEKGKK